MTRPVESPVATRAPGGGLTVTMTGSALGPWPQLMTNPVRAYDWGSTSTLARLQGRPSTGRPEAELWMGAHPSAPSLLEDVHGDGHGDGLDRLVADRPLDLLGSEVFDRFGPRLPFLLKILAISKPLSVQVHPTADRARSAFEGETDVPGEHRYVDPYPKPELLYALEPVDALCGFRPAADARRMLTLLGGQRAGVLAAALAGDDTAAGAEGADGFDHPEDVAENERIEAAFERLVTWPDDDRTALATEIRARSRAILAGAGPLRPGALAAHDRRTLTWAARLAEQHPDDPLVAAPFLLDLVQLQAGETLFVPAGAPHAYLHGLGVEIMGNSDNVLRAGLTHKPIAVEELLHIVHGGSRPQREVPHQWVSPHEVIWAPGVPEFRLARLWLPETPLTAFPQMAGPQIVLCTAGTVRVSCSGGHEVVLQPGTSAFVGASGGPVTLTGPGEVFRAFAGLGRR